MRTKRLGNIYVTKGVDNLDYNSSFNQLNASFKGVFFDKKLIVSVYSNGVLSSSRITWTGYSNGIKLFTDIITTIAF